MNRAAPLPVGLAAATLLAAALPAQATSPIAEVICAPSAELTDRLESQFGESLRAQGLRDHETMLEVWSSDRTGRWTLVMSYASGQSCIVAMGEHWDQIPSPQDPA